MRKILPIYVFWGLHRGSVHSFLEEKRIMSSTLVRILRAVMSFLIFSRS